MPSILEKGLEQGMVRNFYQLRMGKYAGALIQRSRCERQQILWLQLNLMRLGNELAPVEYCLSGKASQSDTHEMRLRQCRTQIASE
ncbi:MULTISPECIES: hypothetical protein [unclassified Bradyrhizobium]|uniref:hypothetical protein n=1 Tax=unclassified Bradyrhizobium TaxID=2631580 RepID=UPI001FFAC38E|nr:MULTISPECIES: hypothetical protein [unclassified Bradyrhizobium]MCK1422572.1 hypothetical protein [Bradyrhizobium sp. CW12]MCK1644763.1 hypothetical protein [Bradyrhizobium sp. 154]